MRYRLALALSLPWLAGCGGLVQAPMALDQAALLTASCSGCHAAGGRAIVSLDGMAASELEAKLLAYRNDADGGSAMHRMARGYSDEQIALIASTLGERAE